MQSNNELMKKMADALKRQPQDLASTDGASVSIPASNPDQRARWDLFFHEVAHLIQANGGKMPEAEKVEKLAQTILDPDTAAALGNALKQDSANNAAGAPSFFKALDDRRKATAAAPAAQGPRQA